MPLNRYPIQTEGDGVLVRTFAVPDVDAITIDRRVTANRGHFVRLEKKSTRSFRQLRFLRALRT